MNDFEIMLRSVDNLNARHASSVRRVSNLETEMEENRDKALVLAQVEELFKFLLDKHVNKYAESFSQVVTEGLQAIFVDQDLEFEIVVSQKNGKVWVDFETLQDGVRGPALRSFGGGVSSVESLLLRLLVLLKTGLAKYLILDESLAALSEHYVEAAGSFIRKMAEELDVNVLLITHNQAFLEHAHTAYKAEQEPSGDLHRLVLNPLLIEKETDVD